MSASSRWARLAGEALPPYPRAIAAARVVEARIRRSRRLRRLGRRAAAALARISPEARAFVRIRLMRLI
jgi:hypothetical protein